MIRPTPGSEDGFTVNLYLANQEYDLTDALAKSFVDDMKVAKYIRTRKPIVDPTPSENTVIEVAPEIKDVPEPAVLTEEEEDIESGELAEEVAPEEKEEPKNTRVFSLARDLGVGWKKVKDVANKLGIGVSVAQAGLTDAEVKKITEEIEE